MYRFEGDLADLSPLECAPQVDPYSDNESAIEEQFRDQLEQEVANNWRTRQEADILLYRFHSDRLLLLGAVSLADQLR